MSTLEHQKSILEDKYKDEKCAHENTKLKLSKACENAGNKEQYLLALIDSKNEEIKSLKCSVRSFKKMIDSQEEELYRMKLHIGSISDTNAGNFSEARSKHTKDTKSPAKQTEDSPPEQTCIQMPKFGNGDLDHLSHKSEETNVLQRNQATPLLLIGSSNIKYIEPLRWQQYTTQKEIAYKTENAIDRIKSYGPDMKPAVVIFHSLTNDIKSQLDAEGCVKKM